MKTSKHLMKSNKQTPTFTPAERTEAVQKITQLVRSAGESLVEAGKLVCDWIDRDPGFVDALSKSGMPLEFVARLEQIGRKRLHYSLVLHGGPAARMIERLPFPVQEKLCSQPVPVIKELESSKPTDPPYEKKLVDFHSLTATEARQALTSFGLRSDEEQLAWLRGRKKKTKVSARHWRIDGNVVLFSSPCKLNRHELIDILAKLG